MSSHEAKQGPPGSLAKSAGGSTPDGEAGTRGSRDGTPQLTPERATKRNPKRAEPEIPTAHDTDYQTQSPTKRNRHMRPFRPARAQNETASPHQAPRPGPTPAQIQTLTHTMRNGRRLQLC